MKANSAMVMITIGVILTSLSDALALVQLYGMYQFVLNLADQVCRPGGTCYSLVSPITLLAPVALSSISGTALIIMGMLRLKSRVPPEVRVHTP